MNTIGLKKRVVAFLITGMFAIPTVAGEFSGVVPTITTAQAYGSSRPGSDGGSVGRPTAGNENVADLGCDFLSTGLSVGFRCYAVPATTFLEKDRNGVPTAKEKDSAYKELHNYAKEYSLYFMNGVPKKRNGDTSVYFTDELKVGMAKFQNGWQHYYAFKVPKANNSKIPLANILTGNNSKYVNVWNGSGLKNRTEINIKLGRYSTKIPSWYKGSNSDKPEYDAESFVDGITRLQNSDAFIKNFFATYKSKFPTYWNGTLKEKCSKLSTAPTSVQDLAEVEDLYLVFEPVLFVTDRISKTYAVTYQDLWRATYEYDTKGTNVATRDSYQASDTTGLGFAWHFNRIVSTQSVFRGFDSTHTTIYDESKQKPDQEFKPTASKEKYASSPKKDANINSITDANFRWTSGESTSGLFPFNGKNDGTHVTPAVKTSSTVTLYPDSNGKVKAITKIATTSNEAHASSSTSATALSAEDYRQYLGKSVKYYRPTGVGKRVATSASKNATTNFKKGVGVYPLGTDSSGLKNYYLRAVNVSQLSVKLNTNSDMSKVINALNSLSSASDILDDYKIVEKETALAGDGMKIGATYVGDLVKNNQSSSNASVSDLLSKLVSKYKSRYGNNSCSLVRHVINSNSDYKASTKLTTSEQNNLMAGATDTAKKISTSMELSVSKGKFTGKASDTSTANPKVGVSVNVLVPNGAKVKSNILTYVKKKDATTASKVGDTVTDSYYRRQAKNKKVKNPIYNTQGVTYIIAYPSSIKNKSGYLIGKLQDACLNSASGKDEALEIAKEVLGENSGVMVSTMGNVASKNISIGSHKSGNRFSGYNVIVYRDEGVRQAYKVTTTLNENEISKVKLNIGPTISVDTSYGDVTVSKHSEYGGKLLTWNANFGGSVFSIWGNRSDNFKTERPLSKTYTVNSQGGNLNHSYLLTRCAFGDNITLSAFHSANNGLNANVLKSVGATKDKKPKSDTNGGTVGAVDTITGRDKFLWKATKIQMVDAEGNTYWANPLSDGMNPDKAGYELTEKVKRYTAKSKSTGSVSNKLLKSSTSASSKYGYLYSSAKNLGTKLKYYPEVAMKMGYDKTPTNAWFGSSATKTVYALGEKARTVKASAMFSFKPVKSTTDGNFTGRTTSAGGASGTLATNLNNTCRGMSKVTNTGKLPVIYAGSNVQTKITQSANLEMTGFVLDLGSDQRIAWGDTSYKAEEKFNSWVKGVSQKLYVAPKLVIRQGGSKTKTMTFGSLSTKATLGQTTLKKSFKIRVQNGAVVTSDQGYKDLIKAIATANNCTETGAKTLFNNSGIIASIKNSLELNGGSNGWYDEQANYFVIKQYTNNVNITGSGVVFNNKVDITTAGNNANGVMTKGYVGDWYATIGVDNTSGAITGMTTVTYKGTTATIGNTEIGTGGRAGTVILKEIPVNNASFIIPNATSDDMRR